MIRCRGWPLAADLRSLQQCWQRWQAPRSSTPGRGIAGWRHPTLPSTIPHSSPTLLRRCRAPRLFHLKVPWAFLADRTGPDSSTPRDLPLKLVPPRMHPACSNPDRPRRCRAHKPDSAKTTSYPVAAAFVLAPCTAKIVCTPKATNNTLAMCQGRVRPHAKHTCRAAVAARRPPPTLLLPVSAVHCEQLTRPTTGANE